MKIKNDFVKIKIGNRKLELHNLILNKCLENYVYRQLTEDRTSENVIFRNAYVAMTYMYIKFDKPLESINENSELYSEDFDIIIVYHVKYNQLVKEKQIISQYDYETENNYVVDIATAGVKFGLNEWYGKKITAIGFSYTFGGQMPIFAVLDTSNYNIYLEKNQDFTVTRRDIITTDAEFWSNDKDIIQGPVHLMPYGVDPILSEPIEGYTDYGYGVLYSVGLGQLPNNMDKEYIIGQDVQVINNGTEFEIVGITNEQIGEGLYPNQDLYPSLELYPEKANYNYVIFKYKVWQIVHSGDEDDPTETETDTGYYYYQAIPLKKFGDLKLKVKYERG